MAGEVLRTNFRNLWRSNIGRSGHGSTAGREHQFIKDIADATERQDEPLSAQQFMELAEKNRISPTRAVAIAKAFPEYRKARRAEMQEGQPISDAMRQQFPQLPEGTTVGLLSSLPGAFQTQLAKPSAEQQWTETGVSKHGGTPIDLATMGQRGTPASGEGLLAQLANLPSGEMGPGAGVISRTGLPGSFTPEQTMAQVPESQGLRGPGSRALLWPQKTEGYQRTGTGELKEKPKPKTSQQKVTEEAWGIVAREGMDSPNLTPRHKFALQIKDKDYVAQATTLAQLHPEFDVMENEEKLNEISTWQNLLKKLGGKGKPGGKKEKDWEAWLNMGGADESEDISGAVTPAGVPVATEESTGEAMPAQAVEAAPSPLSTRHPRFNVQKPGFSETAQELTDFAHKIGIGPENWKSAARLIGRVAGKTWSTYEEFVSWLWSSILTGQKESREAMMGR